jgi:pheromone shutdown-related protein TraB|tara:strand:- start:85867 stop:87069 length:1203 start_codon:yes stop_codon:yes gene_type:complete
MTNLENEPHKIIQLTECRITLLGTAHVSRQSVEAVRDQIVNGDYDAVAIELCDNRYASMNDAKGYAEMDLFAVIKQGKASMVAASLALGAYQQRIAEQFEIQPGAEMKLASDLATAQALPLLLIDRDVGTTLKRVYRSIPWWRKMTVVSGLIASLFSREKVSEEEIEQLKQGDILENAFSQFSESAADLLQPLIAERDEYMAAKITNSIETQAYQNILVVVGAGHLAGLSKHLQEGLSAPLTRIQQLQEIPAGNRILPYLPWLIVFLVVIGFAFGFNKSSDLGWSLVFNWILINGGLSAAGTLLAGGHILTVVVAFFAAPLTSLNPAIGAGVVTAGAEIYLRKPTVQDFQQLRNDSTSFSGWRGNRVARVILVFLLSTVGSALGTYIAGFQIIGSLSSAY